MQKIFMAFLGVLLAVSGARAASSPWFETEGGRIRLVVGELKPGAAVLKGALQVELQPGWKTYWRDPGSSGVPPQIDVSPTPGISGAEIGYPPPHRFEDAYGAWVGYKSSTTFALTFSVDAGAAPKELDAGVFLGICHDICIPVQANFFVELNEGMSEPGAEGIIAEAFAALPRKSEADFGVSSSALDKKNVVVNAVIPVPDSAPELFVENVGGWYFGKPELISSAGTSVRFSLPVIEKPAEQKGSISLPYTLVSGSGAVAGELTVEPHVQ